MFGLMRMELCLFASDIAGEDTGRRIKSESDRRSLPDLLDHLAGLTGDSAPELRHAFGRRTFERFAALYPDFVPAHLDLFDYLLNIEQHIHEEMRDLYPDANPPGLACERISETRMRIRYRSDTPVPEMCAGMIEGAISHFGEKAVLTRHDARDAAAVFEIELVTG